jgi:hypothetical protein
LSLLSFLPVREDPARHPAAQKLSRTVATATYSQISARNTILSGWDDLGRNCVPPMARQIRIAMYLRLRPIHNIAIDRSSRHKPDTSAAFNASTTDSDARSAASHIDMLLALLISGRHFSDA